MTLVRIRWCVCEECKFLQFFSGGHFDTWLENLKIIPFGLVILFPKTYFGEIEMYIKDKIIFIRTLFRTEKNEENKLECLVADSS